MVGSGTLVDLQMPQFIHGDAVDISGVASKTLNNWTQRGTVKIGTVHITGRRLYSIYDLIQLTIVGQFVHMLQMAPAAAAGLGSWAVGRAMEMSERDEVGRLKCNNSSGREARAYVTVWMEGDLYKTQLWEGDGWMSQNSFSHPFIVLPLDDIVVRVINKSFDVLEKRAENIAALEKHIEVTERLSKERE